MSAIETKQPQRESTSPLRGLSETRTPACGCYAEVAEGELGAVHRECEEAKRLRAELRAANDELWRDWYAGKWPGARELPAEVVEIYRGRERVYVEHFLESGDERP